MRIVQLTSNTRLAGGDPSECEEAILEVTREKGSVLQVFDGLSLGVQHPLYSLDDVIAMGEEELEKLDMCLKRHRARMWSGWPLFGRKERMKGQASKRFANHNRGAIVRGFSEGVRGAASDAALAWCGEILRPFGAQKSNCTCSRAKRGLSRVVGVPQRLASTAGVAGSSMVYVSLMPRIASLLNRL